MTKTKPKFHPASVSAALRKAGFDRSEWHRSGMIRGWGESTRGFEVSAIRKGYKRTDPLVSVRVDWTFTRYECRSMSEQQYATAKSQKLDAMLAALSARGFVVSKERREYGGEVLLVTGVCVGEEAKE